MIDDKYFRLAEETLYGELAYSPGLERDEVKQFVIGCMKETSRSV